MLFGVLPLEGSSTKVEEFAKCAFERLDVLLEPGVRVAARPARECPRHSRIALDVRSVAASPGTGGVHTRCDAVAREARIALTDDPRRGAGVTGDPLNAEAGPGGRAADAKHG